MDKRILETILAGQREKLSSRLPAKYLHRLEYERRINVVDPAVPQVLTGVRGAGKTTMAVELLQAHDLQFGYINFDDPRLANLTPADLEDILEVTFKIGGRCNYILFDELPRLQDWLEALSVMASHGMRAIVTVSGCHIMMERVGEAVNDVHLFPLTFRELCEYRGLDVTDTSTHAVASLRALFDEYLRRGGLPGMIGAIRFRRYLDDVINTSLRYTLERSSTIANNDEFVRLARYVLDKSPITLSYRRLADEFDVRSEHTVKKYLSLLKRSGLMLGLEKIAFRDKQRTIGEKLYAIDPAVTHFSPRTLTPEDMERSMLTVINRHLLHTVVPEGFFVHYYADRTVECDFVVCRDMQMQQGIQVCYDATDTRRLRRKVSGLQSLSRVTGCTDLLILTDNQSRDIAAGDLTIRLRPAYAWLLNL